MRPDGGGPDGGGGGGGTSDDGGNSGASVEELGLGAQHACARFDEGTVQCWGQVIGLPPMDASVRIVSRGAISLTAGYNFACSVDDQGHAECWGANYMGQLGDGSGANSLELVSVGLAEPAQTVTSGGGFGACALLESGKVACWGSNSSGQAGQPKSMVTVRIPTEVPGVAGAASVSVGLSSAYAVFHDGGVQVWGFTQLAGEAVGVVPFPTLGPVRSVAVGQMHSCALLESGRMQCWGRSTEGQLGFDAGAEYQASGLVTGLDDVTSACAAVRHTCAVQNDGGTWCWGDNTWGQLGTGNYVSAPVPRTVELPAARAVFCHEKYSCAVTEGGVYCWGDNAAGQFGVASPVTATRPVAVPVHL